MKKKIFTMLALLMTAVTGAWAQEQLITIGNGEHYQVAMPCNFIWAFNENQMILTADEIGCKGRITSVAYKRYSEGSGDPTSRNIDIYMVHTTKDAYGSTEEWIPVTSADLVYSGEFTFQTAGEDWQTITLDTPFEYNGTDNLCICIDDNTGSTTSRMYWSAHYTSNISRSIRAFGTNVDFDPTLSGSPVGGSTLTGTFVADIQLGYIPTFDYELTVEASDHGSGTISYTVQDKDDAEKITENAKGANEGDKVTVKVTPDEGWRVDDTKNSHGDVTALLYRYWEGSRRAAAMIPMQRTVDLKYEDEENGVFTYSFTMPASNVKVKAEYLKLSTLYFDPADKTNLMEVNVDYIVRNVEDSKTFKIEKVEKVTEGAPVKLTANTGYKFRKVEVKKGSAAKTITIGDVELTYADGDNWQTIVGKNSDKIKILSNRIVQVAQPAPNTYKYIDVLTTAVKPSDFIDPSKNYQWGTLEVAW